MLTAARAPVWHVTRCIRCKAPIYYMGGTMEALRSHMSWAHPVYKTRLQSIQETGRRTSRRRRWFT